MPSSSLAAPAPLPPGRASARSARALGAVGLGLLAAFFFTFTYVLSRASAVRGGDWRWTACLRYLITLPLLWPLMRFFGGARPVLRAIRAHPLPWLAWSGIGFGLFYLGLSFGATMGPAWLLTGTFEITVVAGMICAPLLYRDGRARIPAPALGVGILIVLGVALMQAGRASGQLGMRAGAGVAAVVVSAFAYPLGNRGLLLHLERTGERLSAAQRVFGMTLATQPLWWVVALGTSWRVGLPRGDEVALAFGVALSAGIIASILFFEATGRVKDDPAALGAVEAMQAAELLFSTLLGAAFLREPPPHGWSTVGFATVLGGILLFGAVVARRRG